MLNRESKKNYDKDVERQYWETWNLERYQILRTAYRLPFLAGTPRIFLRALARSLGFSSFLIPLIINWSKFDLADRVAPFHFAYSHPARYLSLSLPPPCLRECPCHEGKQFIHSRFALALPKPTHAIEVLK